ncbi:MAG: hypothetical protein PVH00_04735 [Gemmatimonadota bacterium]
MRIVVTSDALEASPELLGIWLKFIVDDARHAVPAPPGYYFVRAAGVSVRGMKRVDFEVNGQAVHCRVLAAIRPGAREAKTPGSRTPADRGPAHDAGCASSALALVTAPDPAYYAGALQPVSEH